MSKRNDALYLGHMLDAARRVHSRVSTATRDEFDRSEDLQIVLTHFLRIIGESARKVSETTRNGAPNVPWADIVGMRHKIVHDYMYVDLQVVWDTAVRDIPPLLAALEKITPPEPPSV